MKNKLIDTNVIIRFLVESSNSIDPKFSGVFSFFEKLEKKEKSAFLTDLTLFQAYFVLCSYYEVPSSLAASKLAEMVSFSGIEMNDKPLILSTLELLQRKKLDLVDAYLFSFASQRGDEDIYSYDTDLKKLGLKLAKIE